MTPIEQLQEEVEQRWQSWRKTASENGVSLAADPSLLSQLKQVWEGSDYLYQCCAREPALLAELVTSGDLDQPFESEVMASRLQAQLSGASDEAALQRTLRRFRRYQMMRIIWRDLAATASLEETLEDLSALADACVGQALDKLYAWQIEKLGVPRDEHGMQQHLVVLGMGKLGARELNLSSDIDLIFSYPRAGEVEGPRYLSNEQFFTRLCQHLIKAIGTQTVDGFVFRVDTRLRPFGDSGPLVLSFDAMETYYHSEAREWERYAMIKARVVAGDQEHGEQLMAMLRPFVYRRYLDFGPIESLRNMKQLISQELKRKGMADNIKLGPGGIREIEFIGQAFQLIRGGRDPELQIRPIQMVLWLLAEKSLLPEYVVKELVEAYKYLRLVENRIQAWQDRQTHLLPEDDLGRLRLARAMGCDDWQAFFQHLDHHRQRVQGHFDKVFAAPQTDGEAEDRRFQDIWEQYVEGVQAQELLEEAGFENGAESLQRLDVFRSSHTCRGLGAKGRERLDRLMPLLLAAIAGSSAPDQTLDRLIRLLEAIARRTSYLALLVESPLALSQLVRLTSISPWISQQIARQPLLLDEMLDPRRLYTPLRRESLESELDTLLSVLDRDDLEQRMERLRQFSKSNMLRVAAADITGVITLMVVSDYLTEIAESVIARVMDLAWADLTARHGRPTDILGQDKGFAVIGYGKLGGLELGYGSDLDLVFIHGSSNPNAMTDGEKPVSNEVFYARLGQRMIHMFTTRTPSGLLYEVDMRLRPNGNSGMLATPIETFERYQHRDAWTWEHQALLRARPVAGDPAVCERFQTVRREVLGKERDEQNLRGEVRKMRERMRSALDRSADGCFDIKQGHGGIADIEFMVQYSVLRWASRYPDLLQWTDNIRLLETLASHQLLTGGITDLLADAYRSLRAVYHRNALGELPGLIADGDLLEQRRTVAEIWHNLMEVSGE